MNWNHCLIRYVMKIERRVTEVNFDTQHNIPTSCFLLVRQFLFPHGPQSQHFTASHLLSRRFIFLHPLLKPLIKAVMDLDCRSPYWHRREYCENSDAIAALRLRKMNSDLFQKHGVVPAAQNEIMNRNGSTSPLLRLPPEIRLRIYKYVFGGQRLWIDCRGPEYGNTYETHLGARFRHFNMTMTKNSDRTIDICVLRVCRQIFTEAALLPYAFNDFIFESQQARRHFNKSIRPGKKQVVKKAIGAYSILPFSTLEGSLRTLNERIYHMCEESDE